MVNKQILLMLKKYKTEILYLIFGLLTTFIYLGTYKIFLLIGIHYIISTNISFVFAVIFAFFTNRHIVFIKGDNLIREFIVFVSGRIATQIINNLGLVFFVENLKLDSFISQVILSFIVIILNYLISKYAVFIKAK